MSEKEENTEADSQEDSSSSSQTQEVTVTVEANGRLISKDMMYVDDIAERVVERTAWYYSLHIPFE